MRGDDRFSQDSLYYAEVVVVVVVILESSTISHLPQPVPPKVCLTDFLGASLR
jgi:hypothetical protein